MQTGKDLQSHVPELGMVSSSAISSGVHVAIVINGLRTPASADLGFDSRQNSLRLTTWSHGCSLIEHLKTNSGGYLH